MRKLLGTHKFLVCIVLFSLFFRVYRLTEVPGSLYWEEAALGYDAYSIMKTGKDFHGNPFPVIAFTSFGDYKPSLYFYAIVPFMKVLGLQEISVRLPSVLSGVGTVIVLYCIGKLLYGKRVGELAAFVYAIQPWSMHVSRVGFETNLATFLISSGVLFLILSKKKAAWLVPAAAVFVLSMYAYHSARIVAPFLAGTVFLLYIAKSVTKKHTRWLVSSVILAILCTGPILLNVRNPEVTKRAAETGMFSDLGPIQESNAMKEAEGNSLVSRILYHRYVLFGGKILENYTKNFSFDFLFVEGDENIRHQTKEFGVLYYWEVVTLAVAGYVVMRRRKTEYWIPVLWIIVAGVPVALTTVVPHTLRFMPASPAFALLSGLGLWTLLRAGRKMVQRVTSWRIYVFAVFGVIAVNVLAYSHFYFSHYSALSARDWQYGYRELIGDLEAMRKPGQRVYVTREQGRPSIYYMFYAKLDPAWVQSQDGTVKKDQGEFLELGQYTFTDTVPEEKSVLVASGPGKVEQDTKVLKTVTLPNGEPIWEIWEN